MTKFMQPYQYNFMKQQAISLLQAQRAVNDRSTIATMKALILEKIATEFPTRTMTEEKVLHQILTIEKSQRDLELFLETLKKHVIAFDSPSDVSLKKVFAKTKKLKIPKWESLELSDYTYYGWNDPGKQRKYIIWRDGQRLLGLEGTLEPNAHKGICAICQMTSEISAFSVKGKVSKEGNYLTKGNYICHDSDKCNQQINQLADLQRFVEIVKPS